MKTIKFIIVGCIALFALAACNTVGGVGKDVESLGTGLDNAAQKTSKSL